jgi:beta-glucanase (GH16 family)
MKKLLFGICLFAVALQTCQPADTTPATPTPAPTPVPTTPVSVTYSVGKTPVWQDEFSYTGLPDSTKWDYDLGGSGWGNNELEFYTKSLKNARVGNGLLTIEAIKESIGGRDYSSARLVSRKKGDWLYGRIEVRAKLPTGRGTWPAIWMLATSQTYGNQYWPDNGEIDIMEHVGYDPTVVHGSIHTKAFNHGINTQKTSVITVPTALSAFHVYAIDWYPDRLKFLVDDVVYFEFEKQASWGWDKWPFDQKFHLLLNVAVGGNWGGVKGIDDSIFPQKMEVDYVRVYPLVKQ